MRLITGRLEARGKSGKLDAQAPARQCRSHFAKQGKSLKAGRQHRSWVADHVAQTRTRREGAAGMAQCRCMFLRCKRRLRDGKRHDYWNVVENRRFADGRVCEFRDRTTIHDAAPVPQATNGRRSVHGVSDRPGFSLVRQSNPASRACSRAATFCRYSGVDIDPSRCRHSISHKRSTRAIRSRSLAGLGRICSLAFITRLQAGRCSWHETPTPTPTVKLRTTGPHLKPAGAPGNRAHARAVRLSGPRRNRTGFAAEQESAHFATTWR